MKKNTKRDIWIKKATEQYMSHGVSREKAILWAESIINNNESVINSCPYITAEIDYRR